MLMHDIYEILKIENNCLVRTIVGDWGPTSEIRPRASLGMPMGYVRRPSDRPAMWPRTTPKLLRLFAK